MKRPKTVKNTIARTTVYNKSRGIRETTRRRTPQKNGPAQSSTYCGRLQRNIKKICDTPLPILRKNKIPKGILSCYRDNFASLTKCPWTNILIQKGYLDTTDKLTVEEAFEGSSNCGKCAGVRETFQANCVTDKTYNGKHDFPIKSANKLKEICEKDY